MESFIFQRRTFNFIHAIELYSIYLILYFFVIQKNFHRIFSSEY